MIELVYERRIRSLASKGKRVSFGENKGNFLMDRKQVEKVIKIYLVELAKKN